MIKFENIRKHLLRNSVRAYAGNSLINQPKFKSGYDCGETYTIIEFGKEIKGELIFKPLSMKEYKNSGLANIPLSFKKKDVLEEFKYKGGQIILPINTKFKNKNIIQEKLEEIKTKKDTYAFSIGNFLENDYKDKRENHYSDKSLCIEIIGLNFKKLENIANKLKEESEQKYILIKDYESGKLSLI
jgi:hypothetical protein